MDDTNVTSFWQGQLTWLSWLTAFHRTIWWRWWLCLSIVVLFYHLFYQPVHMCLISDMNWKSKKYCQTGLIWRFHPTIRPPWITLIHRLFITVLLIFDNNLIFWLLFLIIASFSLCCFPLVLGTLFCCLASELHLFITMDSRDLAHWMNF